MLLHQRAKSFTRGMGLLAGVAVALCTGAGTALATEVAFYEGPEITRSVSGNNPFADGDVTAALLADFGLDVSFFSDSSDVGFAAALASADALFIASPESDLGGVLSGSAISVIESYVSGGGALVVTNDSPHHGAAFVNAVFGTALTAANDSQRNSIGGLERIGTEFEDGPGVAPEIGDSVSTLRSSLPAGSKAFFYESSSFERIRVIGIGHGSGRILLVNMNYANAAPLGSVSNDSIEILRLAFENALRCGETPPPVDDLDGDGIRDACDSCPNDFDPAETDTDGDLIADVCDSCPAEPNRSQQDLDGDLIGDACDPDIDGDGVTNDADNCVEVPNVSQADGDGDGNGDSCDLCLGVPNRGDQLSLEATIASIGAGHTALTSLVPDLFLFLGGTGGTAISDGGLDMYDGGNLINDPGVRYSGGDVDDAGSEFGFLSRFATTKHDGLFTLLVDDHNRDDFFISGDLGHDGVGIVSTNVFSINVESAEYTAYVKTVGGALNPSVNHIVIVPGDGSGIARTFDANTNFDGHAFTGLSGVSQLYYLLVSRSSGLALADGDALALATEFLTNILQVEQRDTDGDLTADACDLDDDNDGIADGSDNCSRIPNPSQSDIDSDTLGDECDIDADADGLTESDNCPTVANPLQTDTDRDGVGDDCNDAIDADGDEFSDDLDNCPADFNPFQEDVDRDGIGDDCNDAVDADGDDWADTLDSCPVDADTTQADIDSDGSGDVCDVCPFMLDPLQDDFDLDGVGDRCDVDYDGDGVAGDVDVCAFLPDPGQADADLDGVGDACDNCPAVASVLEVADLESVLDGFMAAGPSLVGVLPGVQPFVSGETDDYIGDGVGIFRTVGNTVRTHPEPTADSRPSSALPYSDRSISDDIVLGDDARYTTAVIPGLWMLAIEDMEMGALAVDGRVASESTEAYLTISEITVDGLEYSIVVSSMSSPGGAAMAPSANYVAIVPGGGPRITADLFRTTSLFYVLRILDLPAGEDVFLLFTSRADGTAYDAATLTTLAETFVSNVLHRGQVDTDNDGLGDVCDADDDGDSIADVSDNCPLVADIDQTDTDSDGVGDLCDLCDGGDDNVDADADGVADHCDVCVDNGGSRHFEPTARVALRREKGRVAFKGQLELPAGRTFVDLDPLTTAVRFRLNAASGRAILDDTLSTEPFLRGSTRGWLVNNTGTKLTYKDRVAGGIVRLVVRTVGGAGASRVSIKARAKRDEFSVLGVDAPLEVLVKLGDQALGDCGATTFSVPDCKTASKGAFASRIKCRQ